MKAIHELAKEFGVPVHMDGARMFNAVAALGVEAREMCKYVDSVMFCISKGLGALSVPWYAVLKNFPGRSGTRESF